MIPGHPLYGTKPHQQCEIMTAVARPPLPTDTCCSTPAACNNTVRLDDALRYVNCHASAFLGHVTQSHLVAELRAGRPIGVVIGPPGGGRGHAVVIVEFDTTSQMVTFNDPEPTGGFRTAPYTALTAQHGLLGQWRATVLTT